MKRILVCLIFWGVALSGLCAQAEEPILVIDAHGHSAKISRILFTPDGKTLISTSFDKTIRLWDVETGDLIRTLRHQIGEGRDGEVHAAALSPDGSTLAIGGITYDHENGIPVLLFDLERGDVIGLLEGHPDLIGSLSFSRDGKWLASSSDTLMKIWDTSKPEADSVMTLESDSGVFDIAFSPDAKKIVSGHVDGTVRVWELPKNLGNASSPKLTTPKKVMKKHTNVACCVDYSSDGKYLVSGDFDGNAFLWTSKGKLKKKFKPMDTIGAIAFAPDGKHVVISGGKHAFVYSIPKGKLITTYTNHAGPIETTAFSNSITAIAFHGNDLVATAGGNEYTIDIWELNTGKRKAYIVGQGRRFEAVAFGEQLQVAFGNTPGGIEKIGLLERVFDFSEMLLSHRVPSTTEFTRSQIEYEDKKLKYTFGQWYELHVQGGGTINNSPSDGWVRSYTFTPKGDIVVGSSHVLKLHDTDGRVIREFVGHNGEVWDVSVSQDGNILASASDDQTIKLWNIETGECLATLFIARDREWVCWTPKGYYTASAGGEKYIGWQLNQGLGQAAKYHPVSVFRKQFHYPDVVKRTIALGNFEKVLAEIQLTERAVSQILPPKVRWISPGPTSIEIDQPVIRIRADIVSDSKLETVKVHINGRVQRGLMIGGESSQTPMNVVNQEVRLMPGENRITIFASNKNAAAISEERIVLCHTEGLQPDLYMVSIGISKYEQKNLELRYADDDARAVSNLFRSQKGDLYNDVIIKELYDLDATQTHILEAIEWLKEEARQQDVVVLFIAAHGTNEEGKYYLLPADSIPAEFYQTAVSWSHFSESLGNLPSRVLLFLDTCHSGQLGQDLYSKSAQVDNTEALREISSEEYGVVIMAASTGREFSLEHPDWKHGAFTKSLLDALRGQADYSEDGVIYLRELDLYVAEGVETLTNGQQHPTTQKPSTITRFPIVQVK